MKRFLVCTTMILAFVMGACSSVPASAESDSILKLYNQGRYGFYETHILVDEDTGVHYVVVTNYDYRGGTAITPRLNADGSLYVS